MRVALLASVLVVLAALQSSSQDTTQTQTACAVEGTVVNAVTQQPLKQAQVSLRAARTGPANRGGFDVASRPTSVQTDANGRFSFDGLNPGRFMLSASHSGYSGQGLAHRQVTLGAGQRLGDLVISLMPDAVIAGHITNAAGKALSGVAVQAMRHSYHFGRTELDQVSSSATNKAGEYRITGLSPGKYYLLAVAQPPEGKPGSIEAYVPTFYPGVSDRVRSVALTVRPGEELAGIDMTLTPVRTLVVKGRVVDALTAAPSGGAQVTLVDEDGNLVSSPYETSADAKGSFEFRGIPRGAYILMAQSPSRSKRDSILWGRKTVRVGEVNVQDAVVVISPGVDVGGRIRIDSKVNVDLGPLTGTLEPSETSALASFVPDIDNATVRADGSFVFHEVPEGSYRLNFSPVPQGFYLKSGAGDPLETEIRVARGQSINGLELVLSGGAPRVEGAVVHDQQPVAGVSVVLIPDGERRGQPGYYRQSVTDSQGGFALRPVPPGDYEIFAWEEIERTAYMDADFLQQFESQGKAVHLKEGDDLQVQLEMIPAGDTIR